MLVSMTGYCSKNQKISFPHAGDVHLTIELKTLNGRFFEVVNKLPSCLSHLEIVSNALLQEKLIRGRVYLNIRFVGGAGKLAQISPSWPIIEQYVQAANAIQAQYKLPGELNITEIMRMPEVFESIESPLTPDDEQVLLAALHEVLAAVVKTRHEEGIRLEKDFTAIFTRCADKLAHIKTAFAQEVANAKEKIREFVATQAAAGETTSSSEANTPQQNNYTPHNQVDEMQIALRKMDIHEEIIRFASHIESVKPLLDKAALEKGKRLDFILQELLRETNTMMAKCPSYDISSACIDIKVELEKAREQVQNIL
ncbi:DUF1732 domain-containing protein [Candidatus Dependentiae bacterium]|nr:DUF1732 domain-containing protein [Candidatus Dependentiae bacterium]